VSLQDNLYVLSHNVETGEITQLPTNETELQRDVNPDLLAHQAELAKKEAARKAVYAKLGLTDDEITALLGGN
jgi:hypothetical protein